MLEAAPETLFFVASMNEGRDVDAQPAYPCSYPTDNVVCVGSTGREGELSSFSDYGAQSVDLAAPGEDILGPAVTYTAREDVLGDGFEAPIDGRWATGGTPDTWDRSFAPRTGGFALADSPFTAYANNTDSYAKLAGGVDMTGRRDCAVRVWARWGLADSDILIVEVSRDGSTWEPHNGLMGASSTYQSMLVDLARLEGRPDANVRFRLVTNGSGTADGVHLDDLSVFCVPPSTHYTGAPDEYVSDDGTSYAAPLVTGVAALLLAAEPTLSAAEVKGRILATVDPEPTLAGKTVTGGRLNAARALEAAAAKAPPPPAAPPPPPAAAASPAVGSALVPGAALRTSPPPVCPKGAAGRAVCLRLARAIERCEQRHRGARRPACVRRAVRRARSACRARRAPRARRACAKTLRPLTARRT